MSTSSSVFVDGSILQTIDDSLSDFMKAEWKATLPFKVCISRTGDDDHANNLMYQDQDLFELITLHGSGIIGRFDPSTYPVDGTGEWMSNNTSWKKLSSDLIAVSKMEGGVSLSGNGFYTKDKRTKALFCSHFKYYNKGKRKLAGGDYREYTMNRDKANARPDDGKSQKKRTSTSRPVKNEDEKVATCKVKLVFGLDKQSFFLICGAGNDTHEGHPQMGSRELPTRKRTVPEGVHTMAKQLANNGVRPGTISGVVEDLYGIDLTRRQVAQTTEMAKLARDLIGTENLEKYKDCTSDADRVLMFLRDSNCRYVALYHRQGRHAGVSNATNKKKQKTEGKATSSASNEGTISSGGLGGLVLRDEDIVSNVQQSLLIETQTGNGDSEMAVIGKDEADKPTADAMIYAADARKAVAANDDQDVLVAIVWATGEGVRYFQAFPEQLSVDGTHKTTNQDWDLITFTIQDMNGRQETVIRCWAPHNRSWLFRWLFQTAVPKLVGGAACKRTRLVICDGYPQECSQLDAAIALVFVSAVRRRCGWHIVDRGWNNTLGKCFGGKAHPKRQEISRLVQVIKDWLYSMMKEVETVNEYNM